MKKQETDVDREMHARKLADEIASMSTIQEIYWRTIMDDLSGKAWSKLCELAYEHRDDFSYGKAEDRQSALHDVLNKKLPEDLKKIWDEYRDLTESIGLNRMTAAFYLGAAWGKRMGIANRRGAGMEGRPR